MLGVAVCCGSSDTMSGLANLLPIHPALLAMRPAASFPAASVSFDLHIELSCQCLDTSPELIPEASAWLQTWASITC